MSRIKLYSACELIPAYLKSWGYVDMDKINTFQSIFEKEYPHAQLEDLFHFFNQKLDRIINILWPVSTVEIIQKRARFKLIFLRQKAYNKLFLFDQLSDDDIAFLRQMVTETPFPIAPNDLPSPMITQKIQSYHPLSSLHKKIKKMMKK